MSPLIIICPILSTILVVVVIVILRWLDIRISRNIFVLLFALFVILAMALAPVLTIASTESCSDCTFHEAQNVLSHIRLPQNADDITVYSSLWRDIEFASFLINEADYLRWCKNQSLSETSLDNLIQPLFEYDPHADRLNTIDDKVIDSLDLYFNTSDGRLQSAFDPAQGRAYVWFIGR